MLSFVTLVNNKQKRTLRAIFDDPTKANIRWSDVESLFLALGAELHEGKGSGIRVELNGVRWRFYRPHPQDTAGKGRIEDVRTFLKNAGVES